MTITRPMFSIREAVDACQVSEKTVRRLLPTLKEHGARQDGRGRWLIPWEALVAVDLKPGRPKGPDVPGHADHAADQVTKDFDQAPDQARDHADLVTVQAEIDRLRAENVLLKKLVETQEFALELAKRQLPPGAPEALGENVENTVTTADTVKDARGVIVDDEEHRLVAEAPKRRRRWLERLRGL